jgi:hypothetical protein
MPPRLPASVLAFMTIRSSDGTVTSLLRKGLEPLLRPGRSPRVVPVAEGDKVTVGGLRMDVLWPPQQLPAGRMRSISKAIAEAHDLAEELAERGAPGLSDALAGLAGSRSRNDRPVYEHHELDLPDHHGLDLLDEEHEPEVEDTIAGVGSHVLRGLRGSREDEVAARKNVARVFRRLRTANNNLSVILLAEDNSALFLGDAGHSVLKNVLSDPPVRLRLRNIDVMLAPHHGSHKLRNGLLPPAKICIAQAGKTHAPRWRRNHRGQHAGGACICIHGLRRLIIEW